MYIKGGTRVLLVWVTAGSNGALTHRGGRELRLLDLSPWQSAVLKAVSFLSHSLKVPHSPCPLSPMSPLLAQSTAVRASR